MERWRGLAAKRSRLVPSYTYLLPAQIPGNEQKPSSIERHPPQDCFLLPIVYLRRRKGFPHPGNALLGCFDNFWIVLLEGEF
jgi:hypothetical protein